MDGPSWTEFLVVIGIMITIFTGLISYSIHRNDKVVEKHDKTLYNPETGVAVHIATINTNIGWIMAKLGVDSDGKNMGGD